MKANLESNPTSDRVVALTGVTRRYDTKLALNDVTLEVPRGIVCGLVGENGAGKTTLIKHLLGLLRAQEGSVRVFGLDPVADPVGVLGRIGYVSEDRDLPGWMRVGELIRYTASFYPGWDPGYAESLRVQLGLNPETRIRDVSRGELAKAGLLLALAHRPELLVLDEPSSGLDPVVRRDILEAIIRTVAEEGRTVLFSSHLLDEVERVSDQVAMMHGGRVVLSGSLEAIKESHHRLTLRFERPPAAPPDFPGALSVSGGGREWSVVCNGSREDLIRQAREAGATISEEATPTLDEIFVARAGAGKLAARTV